MSNIIRNDIARARALTVGSFLVNFAAQTFGMIIIPNMKEIAEMNHFAFSPNPYFVAAFFSVQAVVQLFWIRKLFQSDPPNGYQAVAQNPPQPEADSPLMQPIRSQHEDRAWKVALAYAPVYAIGNLCIACWVFFWLRESFVASQVFVSINTFLQLFAVILLPPLRPDSPNLHKLTHLVAKMFAGIGVLDFIDNGGIALRYDPPPSTLVQAATYTFFPVVASFSGPLFGSILLYDLVALLVGQIGVEGAGPWPRRLGWTTLATSLVVALRFGVHGWRYFRRW